MKKGERFNSGRAPFEPSMDFLWKHYQRIPHDLVGPLIEKVAGRDITLSNGEGLIAVVRGPMNLTAIVNNDGRYFSVSGRRRMKGE